MRPAWVGAGIWIPKVHFDRACRRCGHVQRVWTPIEGESRPQEQAMTLPAWLEANGVDVKRPAGEIRYPISEEIEAMVAAHLRMDHPEHDER